MNFKKIITLLLALALCVMPLVALTSCGGDGCTKHTDKDGDFKCDNCGEAIDCNDHIDADVDGKCDYCSKELGFVYTVTVKDSTGKAIENAKVQLLLDGVAPVGNVTYTNADGKAAFTFKNSGNYYAKVTEVPDGYVLPTSTVKLVDNAAEFSVAQNPLYTVYVKNAAGEAISGVAVQICSASGACQLPKVTDAEGKIESRLTADSYKALILSAPEDYVVPADYIYFDAGNNTLTITLELK